jgi:hypothetical protein
MVCMVTRGGVQPESARDAAEFVVLLRSLKRKSGRTLRELEERATEQGASLPRSTTADMLRRGTLPRPELLAAFVCACGDEQRLPQWLSTRERLASGPHLDHARTTVVAGRHSGAPGNARRRTPAVVATLVVLTGTLIAAAWFSWTRTGDESAATPPGSEVFPLSSAGGWVRIHPAGAPELCLTEGREHTGGYDSAIAVLRPCDDPGGPRVFLQPVRTELVTIKWEHPVDHGMGCLTVLDTGPVEDMLEPQVDCDEDDHDQLFRVEHLGEQRYRMRTPDSGLCLGLRENRPSVDTEALRQPCAAEGDQEFLVSLDTGESPRASVR